MGHMGMGHMDNVDTGKWGTGCVGHMASEAHRANGYRGMGHIGNRDTGGNGVQGV